MLDNIGDILNWSVAGVVFPLMLAPLAGLFSDRRGWSTLAWALLVSATTLAGVAFAVLVPALRAAPAMQTAATFAAIAAALTAIMVVGGGAHRMAARCARLCNAVTTATGRAVIWFLLIMALVQFAVVLLRYVFGVNWIFMQESITYMHGTVFMLAAGYALLTNDHVRVDIFYREAPARRKALVDLVGAYLFLFPICLLIFWTSSPYVARSWAIFEGSTDTSGIQGVFLLKSLIPGFALLLVMAGFVIAHRAVQTLKGRSE